MERVIEMMCLLMCNVERLSGDMEKIASRRNWLPVWIVMTTSSGSWMTQSCRYLTKTKGEIEFCAMCGKLSMQVSFV